MRSRKIKELPVELTSRESTSEIAKHKAALDRVHADADHVDVEIRDLYTPAMAKSPVAKLQGFFQTATTARISFSTPSAS